MHRSLLVLALVAVTLMSVPVQAASAAPPKPATTATSSPPAAASSGQTATFGIGPASASNIDGRPYFALFASPGAQLSDHVAVVNLSNQPLPLLLYPTDATNAPSGAIAFSARAQPATQTGSWISLDLPHGTSAFTAKARSTTIVAFHLTVPANASPGDHAAGIAVGLVAQVSGPSTKNLGLEQRVVSRVFVRVSGPLHPALSVEDVHADYHGTFNPFGQGSVTVRYTVRNTGNVNLQGHQQVSVSGLFGGSGSVPAVADLPILLPGGSMPLSTRVNGVWPQLLVRGTVHVTPVSLPGDANPALKSATGHASFWAVPWTLLALVLLALAGAGAWWNRRRRRRTKRSLPPPAAGPMPLLVGKK